MSLTLVSRPDFARELGLLTDSGAVAERGIADLLRQPLSRWGLSSRRSVTRFVRAQLEAAGIAELVQPGEVGRVLERLQAHGECQEVRVGDDRFLAPCAPRWVPTGEGRGVLLSVSPAPKGVVVLDTTSPDDLVRRIRVADDDDLAALHLGGVRRSSLAEWIRPLHYLRHAGRRRRALVRDDRMPLGAFWELLVDQLAVEGLVLGEDSEVRVLTGAPGSFFGRHDAAECDGRWSREADNGVWCAYRRGYSEQHWHPILLAVDGERRRGLDLYDADEWRWALLARGRAEHADEVVNRGDASVTLSFPPPLQLSAALDLLGHRTRAWGWAVPDDAPELWSLLP